MPIHIKELLIRTVVEQQPENSKEAKISSTSAAHSQEEIIAQCVKEVMKQLQYLSDR